MQRVMKKRNKWLQAAGTAVLTILGFGSCCSVKTALKKPPVIEPVVYGPAPVLIDSVRVEPRKPEPEPVVYGPPIVNFKDEVPAKSDNK